MFLRGDGSTNATGIKLKEDQYYGCASSNSRGLHKFHQIDIGSLQIECKAYGKMTYPRKKITTNAKRTAKVIGEPCVDISKDMELDIRIELIRAMLQFWMDLNPGCAVVIGGTGKRAYYAGLSKIVIKKFGKIPFRTEQRLCVQASIATIVRNIRGPKIDKKAWTKLGQFGRSYGKLGHSGSDLSKLRMGSHIRKLTAPKHKEFACNRLGFLFSLRKGWWLVRLVQGSVVDLCVAIDGEERMIYDSAENYPLQLCMEALRQCSG